MKQTITDAIQEILTDLGIELAGIHIVVDYPADMAHGDFSTNIAMSAAKKAGRNPLDLALQISERLKEKIKYVTDIQIAKPGFINFKIDEEYFTKELSTILKHKKTYGKNDTLKNKKVIVEHTDPNPFKLFHVGHVMQNAIGESISRLYEWTGADLRRFCYQGDVGRHVALTMYGLRFMEVPFPAEGVSLDSKVRFMGQAYAKGATYFKEHPETEFPEVTAEVQSINKKIYDRSDAEINEIYDKGREWSLEYFEEIYAILDTKFDRYFFESESSEPGINAVRGGLKKGIFKESDGAIIFNGEQYGLHTDVFITKVGLPTYAGKEMGLAEMKYDAHPYDIGITVTANEQNDFFKITLKAIEILFPFIGNKAKHISHGMMRLPSGKMSSRTGDVIAGRDFIDDMTKMALEKMADRKMSESEKAVTAQQVAVAAIKYIILRQTIGKDIIFDQTKALSFDGDSGPYLQYSCVRARSILKKSKDQQDAKNTSDVGADANISASISVSASNADSVSNSINVNNSKDSEFLLPRLLARFPHIVARSQAENAPHHVAQYLTELAGVFNSFYANHPILTGDTSLIDYRLSLVESFEHVMCNGLWLLGIKVPAEM